MGFKILVVDDNEDYTDSIKDILEDEGYEVETAHNGEDACKLTDCTAYDLVLMDIKMPGMNGVESFLKMKRTNPDVKVVLFTAYALTELIQKARDNGVTAILKKPLDMDELYLTIENAIAKPNGGYILLADDDRALCENLYDALSEYGYRVAMACGAHEAIREAERQAFDILLLDLKMPDLNGLEVYRRIKKLQPQVVTILMTGYAEEMNDLIKQAIDESAYTMLPKPIDMHQLFKLMERIRADVSNGKIRKPVME